MPKLLLKYHAAVLKEIPIEKTPLTIGRKPDNDIAIDNMAISSHHARITMQGKTYMIEDLQSTNGTFLNEKRILTSALQHNDTILLGQHSLQFVFPESVQAAAVETQETVVINPEIQKQILAELAASVAAVEKPAAPVIPDVPVEPVTPVEAVKPPEPVNIVEPVKTLEPVKAVEPAEPPKAETPVEPPAMVVEQTAPPSPESAPAARPAAAPPSAPPPAPVPPPIAPAAVPPLTEPIGPIGAPKSTVSGHLKVIEGKAEQNDYDLTTPLTYIGKSETAAIKIKGFFAPDIAVLISKRPAGFLMTAVKDGYPKVNNSPVSGQLELKDNDILEIGGIKFLFQIKPA